MATCSSPAVPTLRFSMQRSQFRTNTYLAWLDLCLQTLAKNTRIYTCTSRTGIQAMLRQQQSPISWDGNGRCWHPCRAFFRRFGGAAFRSIGVYLPEYGFVCTSSNRDSVVAGENDVVLQRIKQQFDGRAALYEKDNTYHPPLAQVMVLRGCPQWCTKSIML